MEGGGFKINTTNVKHLFLKIYLLILAYIVIGGSISLKLFNYFHYKGYYSYIENKYYFVDTNKGLEIIVAFTVIMVIVYWLYSKMKFNSDVYSDDLNLLKKFSNITLIVGVLGVLLRLKETGLVLLMGNEGELTKSEGSGISILLLMQLSNSVLFDYMIIYYSDKKKGRVFMAILKCLILLLFGSRNIVITIILTILIHRYTNSIIKFSKMKIIIIAIVVGVSSFAYKSLLTVTEYSKESLILRLTTDFAPEYREYLKIVTNVPDYAPYISYTPIIESFAYIIPEEVFSAVGASKSDYYLQTVNYVKYVINSNYQGGIRSGIYSEVYLMNGIYSILIFAVVVGIVLAFIDKRVYNIKSNNKESMPSNIITIYIGGTICLIQLFGVTVIVYKLFTMFLFWYPYKILAKSKFKQIK